MLISIISFVCNAAKAIESAKGNGVAPIPAARNAYLFVASLASFAIASSRSFKITIWAFLIAFCLPSDTYLYVSRSNSSAPLGFKTNLSSSSISTNSSTLRTLTIALAFSNVPSSFTFLTNSDSFTVSLFVNTAIVGIPDDFKISSNFMSAASILSLLSLMQSQAI